MWKEKSAATMDQRPAQMPLVLYLLLHSLARPALVSVDPSANVPKFNMAPADPSKPTHISQHIQKSLNYRPSICKNNSFKYKN